MICNPLGREGDGSVPWLDRLCPQGKLSESESTEKASRVHDRLHAGVSVVEGDVVGSS